MTPFCSQKAGPVSPKMCDHVVEAWKDRMKIEYNIHIFRDAATIQLENQTFWD